MAMDVQDLRGMLTVNIRLWKITLFSAVYTRVDQAILLWALLTVVIFCTAQFWPMTWTIQSLIWSVFTVLGVMSMCFLTHFWATVERLAWVVWMWAALLMLALVATNVGIFLGISWILAHLCVLWLGVSSLGYLLTALGLQSRTFLIAAAVHGLGISVLHYIPSLPFLTTGFIMGITLWILSELQWDMRSPIEPAYLTLEERNFNKAQQHIREGSGKHH
jgi:hypothetical protein